MNIGDHVRGLHSDEEGFITKIIDEKTIEIEIEDGFTMPMLKRDVVLVKKEESAFFNQKEVNQVEITTSKKSIANIGVYLAFIPTSENFVDLYVINNTDYQVLLTAHSFSKVKAKGLFSSTIGSKSFIEISKWNIKNFDQWDDINIDVLYFQNELATYIQPLSKRVKFQAKAFFNNFKQVPLIEKKGYLYQIDGHVERKNHPLLSSKNSVQVEDIEIPENIIDLHIDQLPDTDNLPPNEVLNHQVKIFQKKLDAAIAIGMQDITFIHGSGNGVLKSKIQKQLSQHINVAYYQDAQKNKFGYGATYVKIK